MNNTGALPSTTTLVDNVAKNKQSRVYVCVSGFGDLNCCFSSQMKAYRYLREHGAELPSYQYFSRVVSKYNNTMWKYRPRKDSSYLAECKIIPLNIF